ncbi:MAG: hypothetical protein JXA96_06830 [Sedimentisphaerales bacterium]|nr:hypothetical protein [Sedimentisphaerales bacterium]
MNCLHNLKGRNDEQANRFQELNYWFWVTVCITLAMGALWFTSALSGERFQIVARDNHVYVFDRSNGRVWERYSPSTSGMTSQNSHAGKISSDSTDKD